MRTGALKIPERLTVHFAEEVELQRKTRTQFLKSRRSGELDAAVVPLKKARPSQADEVAEQQADIVLEEEFCLI